MAAINQYIGPWGNEDAKELKLSNEQQVPLNLGAEYQLGGAYFKNINEYIKKDGTADWAALWNNHIKIILQEYLRGRKDVSAILSALKGEYNKAGNENQEKTATANDTGNPSGAPQE